MRWSLYGLLMWLLFWGAAPAEAGSFITQSYSGLTYKLYIPDGYSAGTDVPLVVMLHGCTQDADTFAAGTEMNSYADAQTFLVAYPQQPSSANSSKCWNWFETAHQSRGLGEPAKIAGIVNQIKSNYSVDDEQVYTAGLSAGAAMAVIMGATYPDVFSGIGVGAGLEYKAATSMINAFSAMSGGGPNPNTQGNVAYNAMGSYAQTVRVIVFHGTSDYTVYPVNGDQVISQWAQTNDRASDGSDNNNIDDTADLTENGSVPGGRSYTRYVYEDNNGAIIMEKYAVTGMGHAWSGGNTAGSYTDPNGPKASEIMLEFFFDGGGSTPDTTPPTTTASPAGG
ncbi:MAG: PHB depolymerase family esterase, partial [Anaerolineales bacterium]|nr:PHB depolymerase family esterase [Anaerolineales bacterium]